MDGDPAAPRGLRVARGEPRREPQRLARRTLEALVIPDDDVRAGVGCDVEPEVLRRRERELQRIGVNLRVAGDAHRAAIDQQIAGLHAGEQDGAIEVDANRRRSGREDSAVRRRCRRDLHRLLTDNLNPAETGAVVVVIVLRLDRDNE